MEDHLQVLYIAGQNKKCYSHFKNNAAIFYKVKHTSRGRGYGDICIHIADSLCCTAETNTTL